MNSGPCTVRKSVCYGSSQERHFQTQVVYLIRATKDCQLISCQELPSSDKNISQRSLQDVRFTIINIFPFW